MEEKHKRMIEQALTIMICLIILGLSLLNISKVQDYRNECNTYWKEILDRDYIYTGDQPTIPMFNTTFKPPININILGEDT